MTPPLYYCIIIELYVTAIYTPGGSKNEKITVGMTIKLVKEIGENIPVGSTATIVYIDDFDQIFIDWSNGGQGKFTEEQLLKNFEVAA